MLKFRGFRASLNLSSGKGSGVDHFDKSPGVSITGAYRINRDESFGTGFALPDPPKKITPSMVKLPNSQSVLTVKPSKSESNLTRPTEPINVRNSTPNISQSNNNGVQLTKIQIKEQKKLEKQRLAEEKKREKIAAKEQQKQEKLRKEREKQTQQAKQVQAKSKDKKRSVPKPQKAIQQQRALPPQNTSQPRSVSQPESPLQPQSAPQPKSAPRPKSAPQPQSISQPPSAPKRKSSKQKTPTNPQVQQPVTNERTNTLESSISRSSGPPPYTAVPETIQNVNDDTGNTSFSKRVSDVGSWDLISQHRQQISRQAGVGKSIPKQKHLDLHYNDASFNASVNSNA